MRFMDEPFAYRVNAACRVLGIGRTKLYGLINEGRIRPIKIGRRVLIPRSELEALVKRLEEERAE
ncbi:helix-turn-helix domain-containing protein [Mongoliimonas terrestris]|uniref:helix-turn-helix domain-containing protein n=1 Tax=Mongoliimonas terrestris TaxID=1709001 RepID=UPI0009FAFDF1